MYLCICICVFVFMYMYLCICICAPVMVHVGFNLNNRCHKNQNLAPIQSVREYPSELDGRRLKSLCRKVHLETQLSEKFCKVLRVHLRSFSAQNIPFFIRRTLQNSSSRLCFMCFSVFHLQRQIIGLTPEGEKLWSGELNVVDDESETLEVRISYILYFTFYSVNKPRGDELIG